jgi:hypothetical protein
MTRSSCHYIDISFRVPCSKHQALSLQEVIAWDRRKKFLCFRLFRIFKLKKKGIRTFCAGELLFGVVVITRYVFVLIRFFLFVFVIRQVLLVTCTAYLSVFVRGG